MPTPILGRDDEHAALDAFVMGVKDQGATLVMRGDAGIGKSTLVEATIERARVEGISVLTATGVRSEMRFPFSGLHQLLRPVIDAADALAPPQRHALLVRSVGSTPRPSIRTSRRSQRWSCSRRSRPSRRCSSCSRTHTGWIEPPPTYSPSSRAASRPNRSSC